MNRKLVVFVPVDALDTVRDAVFAAGAGRIGDYERCSWYTEGVGTFRGLPGTVPTVGASGREEHVAVGGGPGVSTRTAVGRELRLQEDVSGSTVSIWALWSFSE